MYCICDSFFNDINEVIDYVVYAEDKELIDLPDDYTIEVECCTLKPIFQLDSEKLQEILLDVFGDNSSEDGYEWDKVEGVLQKHINFEALNKDIPKLWYPNGKIEIYSKSKLIELS